MLRIATESPLDGRVSGRSHPATVARPRPGATKYEGGSAGSTGIDHEIEG